MFEHSVKVPRHYKVAASIFKKVSTEGGSVKSLLYDNKLRHFRTNVLYALITETIKHAGDIDKIFESCKLLENESRLDPWLAKILTAELLFGKKALPGKSKPEQLILSYKTQFEQYTSDHQDDLKTEVTRRPRYVRINTNLLTTSDAIRAFQDEGYRFIRCTSGSYEDYLQQIQNLTEEDFTQDYHVKTMFVFSSGTKLHEHELYLENKIILQDKATAMAVHLLAPPVGSTVLDMCAAPGMKTTQLAAYIRNTGKVYAVERNEKRYQTLCDFVTKTGSQCVQTMHKDALEIKRGELDDVEYILLDPSCSGSGMDFCVHSYIESTRLAKLTSLQEKFLKHAMNAFPNAKRIVYSTCSLYPEENERVITNVVKTSRAKWRVQDVKELLKSQWNNFGSAMYGSIGTRCMYAKPDTDFTTGFFLAVLDRDEKDLEKSKMNRENAEKGKREENNSEIKNNIKEKSNDSTDDDIDENKAKTKKKKRKAEENINANSEEGETKPDITQIDEDLPKKKKKKIKTDVKEIDVDTNPENGENLTNQTETDVIHKKKKNKKDKHKDIKEKSNDSTDDDIDENKANTIKKNGKVEENINANSEEGETKPDITQIDEDLPKKKKKKIKTDVKDIDVDTNTENGEGLTNQTETDVIHKKKKHKKDKQRYN